ncbi:MAG: histidine phosphatase family protein [Anditalea sp.]
MKKLLICRHAKSAWDDPFLDDHDRPLAPRGLKDCPFMAQRLKRKNICPDLILSSNANRAQTTALITAENLHFPKNNIKFTPKLYQATAQSILSKIRKTQNTVQTLFIFGHNPGFNELIWLLGGKVDNLPTCGQFGFTFDVASWEAIDQENATPWFFDYPKKKPG